MALGPGPGRPASTGPVRVAFEKRYPRSDRSGDFRRRLSEAKRRAQVPPRAGPG